MKELSQTPAGLASELLLELGFQSILSRRGRRCVLEPLRLGGRELIISGCKFLVHDLIPLGRRLEQLDLVLELARLGFRELVINLGLGGLERGVERVRRRPRFGSRGP